MNKTHHLLLNKVSGQKTLYAYLDDKFPALYPCRTITSVYNTFQAHIISISFNLFVHLFTRYINVSTAVEYLCYKLLFPFSIMLFCSMLNVVSCHSADVLTYRLQLTRFSLSNHFIRLTNPVVGLEPPAKRYPNIAKNTSNDMNTTPTHDRQLCYSFNHRFGPSFSGLAIWSVIFQVRQFQALLFGPSFSRSVIFRVCDLVRYFPGPSISGFAIWSVIFQVRHFQALRFGPLFSCPAISGLAFSATPGKR